MGEQVSAISSTTCVVNAMADPLSIAASIAGLLAFTTKLTLTVSSAIGTTRNAPEQLLTLQRQLTALTAALASLNALLETSSRAFTPIQQLAVVLDGCSDILIKLDSITTKLGRERAQGGIVRLMNQAKWVLAVKDAEALLRSLEIYILAINITLNMVNWYAKYTLIEHVGA